MHRIIIQVATDKKIVPKLTDIRKWIKKVLAQQTDPTEIMIRIVDTKEMTELNQTYRKKTGPTNVLAFPMHLPAEIQLERNLLGDIIICADVVNKEAERQGKSKTAHWAHIAIHGTLHLLGYDHQEEPEAQKMEALEIELLAAFDFPNPYERGEQIKDYD